MATRKSTGWFDPYILNPHNIDKYVWEGRPGVYVLGNLDGARKVKVEQIRMSRNVKEDLRKNLGKFHVFMYKPLAYQRSSLHANQQTLQFV